MTRRIDVDLGSRSHAILIEPGAIERLGTIVADVAPHARAMLAVDSNIAATHGRTAQAALEAAGYDVVVHEVAADEEQKTLRTVNTLYDAMLAFRMERRSPVVAVGGGIVGDVAGFAAASYLRGVPVVQVPTTLLAMVDASIGGKTGVNLMRPADSAGRRDLGKNLVGAFHQPRAVVADPRVLTTLEPRDFRCGLAESIKHGVLGDPALFDFLETNAARMGELDDEALADFVAASARVKVGVVQSDEREAGRRMLLNLGHTFAHAVEPIARQGLRHGEAVAIGLCAAAACAVAADRFGAADAARLTTLVEAVGLPVRLALPESAGRLIEAMAYDKKVAEDSIRLVLPTAIGHAEVARDVPRAALLAGWAAVGATDPA